MSELTIDPTVMVFLAGLVMVGIGAGVRFSHPDNVGSFDVPGGGWRGKLQQIFRRTKKTRTPLFIPARAHTTLFRYRLYQSTYIAIGLFLFWAIHSIESVREQIQVIINIFGFADMPFVGESGVLVLATFVVFVLPNIPPFSWADGTVRRLLYDRAKIPAQQLREMHRLKQVRYIPPQRHLEEVRRTAVDEGFSLTDIQFNPDQCTTQSLWCKCMLVIRQIKLWQAEDRYKTAFAVLMDESGDNHAVDVLLTRYNDLLPKARYYFSASDDQEKTDPEELQNLEEDFRGYCKEILEECYKLLSRISLHTHYTDRERVRCFNKIGFNLKENESGPIPDLNDLLVLILLLGVFIVIPLSQPSGMLKALMIGGILLSAILTPVVIARIFPSLRSSSPRRYSPNLAFPVVSGIAAAAIGFLILSFVGGFLQADEYCSYTGIERYTNCSYPWSYLHGGLAFLLAWRMRSGSYPDINKLNGWRRYQIWGDFKDALICSSGLLLIVLFAVIPTMESLGRELSDSRVAGILVRVFAVSFSMGFIVPTWYRARTGGNKRERRRDFKERARFEQELQTLRSKAG
jgi:hypothetical protein